MARSRVIATHEQVDDEGHATTFMLTGQYNDAFQRTLDGWRIRHRVADLPQMQGKEVYVESRQGQSRSGAR
jgi:hypothetical protein